VQTGLASAERREYGIAYMYGLDGRLVVVRQADSDVRISSEAK
jgi:hypothetical protein